MFFFVFGSYTHTHKLWWWWWTRNLNAIINDDDDDDELYVCYFFVVVLVTTTKKIEIENGMHDLWLSTFINVYVYLTWHDANRIYIYIYGSIGRFD